ncbi:MAG TPA: ABC transporter ATP-binding protein [Trueperaceae bacterium]|nr:ABC transporter ATP-binding protein [Trueperaceae bacterium]
MRRFFEYYRPYKGLFLLDFSSAVVLGVLELAFPIAVQGFIDGLLPSGQWRLIFLAALGLALVYLLNTALTYVVTYWGHMLGINIETDMRRKAFDHLQRLSFRFYDEQKTGHLVGRIAKDLEDIGELAHHGPEDVFIAVMTLVASFVLMLFVNVPLALITMAIVPFTGWFTTRYGGKMTRTWREIYARVGAFNARLEETIGGIRVVKAFTNEEHERRLFAQDNLAYRATKLEAYRIMALTHSSSYLSMRLTQLVVMVAGSYFVITESLSAGGFVAFLLLVNVFFRPIQQINQVIELYPRGIAGFKRYLELLSTEPDIVDRPGAIEVEHLRGDIAFEDVHFSYSSHLPVLEGVSLTIAAGETVAFVGPSGAGKTTIASLLPRFYDVDAGRITIDGIDVRDMTLASLRRQIGIVQQDVFLFAGTLGENIAYGRLGAGEDEILAAARRAQLDDLLTQLPKGLDTLIGERGVKLSGGQKQRLSIARIFLKNPPILILDEATSALDTETERAIQQALEELSRGRTTLVIAHRLATIRGADRIVVVDDGRVVEQGRHDELLARGGVYRRLHEAQFGDAGRLLTA